MTSRDPMGWLYPTSTTLEPAGWCRMMSGRVTQPSAHLHPAPLLKRRQLSSSVQSSHTSVAHSSHAMQFCHPRHTLRAVSMTSVPRVAARSSSAMTWGPMLQPVLRRALIWETGVLALSVALQRRLHIQQHHRHLGQAQLHQQTAILPAHLTRTSVGGSRQITAALTG